MEQTMGKRIAFGRKALGLTQDQMAEKLGVTAQAVSKWENDVSCPDISLLPQLCRWLGITTDELLTGKRDEVMLVPEAQRKSLDELTLRVKVDSTAGDKVRVNLPMSLVKIALEMGVEIVPGYAGEQMESIRNLDMRKIIDLVERGAIGKLVEIESANGDTVEIVVE